MATTTTTTTTSSSSSSHMAVVRESRISRYCTLHYDIVYVSSEGSGFVSAYQNIPEIRPFNSECTGARSHVIGRASPAILPQKKRPRTDGTAESLREINHKTCWRTGSGTGHHPYRGQTIICRLHQPALIGFIKVSNKGCSDISVSIAASENKKSDYITVHKKRSLPHNKQSIIRASFLPAQYIRFHITRGAPISMYYIHMLGVPLSALNNAKDAPLYRLLVSNPVALLLQPDRMLQSPDAAGTNIHGWSTTTALDFGFPDSTTTYHEIREKVTSKLRTSSKTPASSNRQRNERIQKRSHRLRPRRPRPRPRPKTASQRGPSTSSPVAVASAISTTSALGVRPYPLQREEHEENAYDWAAPNRMQWTHSQSQSQSQSSRHRHRRTGTQHKQADAKSTKQHIVCLADSTPARRFRSTPITTHVQRQTGPLPLQNYDHHVHDAYSAVSNSMHRSVLYDQLSGTNAALKPTANVYDPWM
jgi:hypothetical protein